MQINIEGVIQWSDKDLKALFEDKDGVPRSGKYIRDWLRLQFAQGKRVLPMGKCVGFDYQNGCPGHASGGDHGEIDRMKA